MLKNVIERPLPVYDLEVRSLVRHLVGGGGVNSFPSSAAANCFGMATCWFWLILKLNGRRWTWLWVWAGLICYAQIYVGSQFPSDVTAGSLLGFLVGTVMAKADELFQAAKFSPKKLLVRFPAEQVQNHQ